MADKTGTATSTKFRPVAKLIDTVTMPFWVIDTNGRLVFLSGAVGQWLGVEPDSLLGRQCIAGASISDDPLDFLAASLSAPPGFAARGSANLMVQPTLGGKRAENPEPLDTRFVRLGDQELSLTLAVAGVFDDHLPDPIVDAAVLLRRQIDSWRRHHDATASLALLGDSRQAARMRSQARVASQIRTHTAIVSPPGCHADSVSSWIHQQSAPGEPIASIDGPLMDPELLDASLRSIAQHLAESDTSAATAVLFGAEETPIDAQVRLCDWVERYDQRLRIIAVIKPSSLITTNDDSSETEAGESVLVDTELPTGIDSSLGDLLCGLTVRLHSLSSRVQDIPVIAMAILDRRRAAESGAGTTTGEPSRADRLTRATLDAMVMYPWPDNLIEMDQAIRHAMRVCRSPAIGIDHLPLAIRSYRPNESVPVSEQSIDLDRAVARYESELILQTLAASDGNRAEAARRLNISRARLLRKIDLIAQGE